LQDFGWKTWRKETNRKSTHICKSNIKMNFKEIGWEYV
jgi:hypothetical protein